MRNPAFTFGVLLGGAFVAAVLNDTFREKCRQGLVYLGNEANNQFTNMFNEFTGNLNGQKGQDNGNDGISQTQNLPASRCSDGYDSRPE